MLPPRYDDLNVRGLSTTEWNEREELDRVSALQELEDQLAQKQQREPCVVRSVDMRPSLAGGLSVDGKTIYIANRDLLSASPHEAVGTTAHEGFHAYQEAVVANAADHPEVSDVRRNNWRYNQASYIDPAQDSEAYEAQFTERDARVFGEERTRQLCGQSAKEQAHAAAIRDMERAKTMKAFDDLAFPEPPSSPERSAQELEAAEARQRGQLRQ